MTTNTDAVSSLPDDLNPEIVKATAAFIGKITGLVPPPHDAFPPEWHGYLRAFTGRLNEIARENATPVQAETVQAGWVMVPNHANTDAIVTSLYRRFKEWSKRGFGPDEVTWCEVKADVQAMLAMSSDIDTAKATLPAAVLDALRFYAHGHHFNIDADHQQFDTVSGEPQNWLCSERDDDCTMIEDGSIAKAVLLGGLPGFEEPTEPLEGEVFAPASTAGYQSK